MQVPVDIRFEGLDPSDFVTKRIQEEVAKLEQFFDKIISCHVVVQLPHKHHQHGNLYGVKIYLALPGGKTITVDRLHSDNQAHEDVYVAIRDAFRAARRQLQDVVRKWQAKAKPREPAGGGL